MNHGRLRGFTLALTLAGTLLAASPAAAATFFAAPGSTRTTQPCASDTPCRLDYAMLAAGSGSDVSVAPGDYYDTGTTPLPGLPPVPSGVIVHGSSVSDPPVIHGHVFANAVPFLEVKSGGTIRDLELISDTESKPGNFYGYTLQIDPTAVVTRVVSHGIGASGVGMTACAMLGGTLLDTACIGSGGSSVNAVGANSSASTSYVLRNVTAITTAGTGVAMGTFNQTVSMTATNVIARGTTSDVSLVANDPAGTSTLTIDHSNWGTFASSGTGNKVLTQGTGNQNGPTAATPLFVNAGAGDYRQATGSPTIDAGVTDDANGQLALGGLARVLGVRTDMGAYEHVPAPSATSGPATGVTDSAAKITGTVVPDGVASSARFEYGTSANYGRTANLPAVAAGAGPTPVSANLTGLAPDITYHYRLVVIAGTVTSRGQDRTFHTLDTPTGPGGTQINPAVASAVTIGSRWRLGRHLPEISRKRRPPVGTTIAFTLSKGTQVTLTFSQRIGGRMTSGHCRRRSSRNRGKRRCTFPVVRGKISLAGYAGRNSLHFEGRISSGRRLKPGRHLLTVTPVGASPAKSVSFTIVR